MTFCEIILVGHIGADAEVRYTPNGATVCNFRMAVNRSRRQGNEWIKETTWFRITVWAEQAERVGEYAKKGRQVLVVGDRIEVDTYTAQNGEVRTNIDVTARTVRLVGGGSEGGGDEGGSYSQRSSSGGASSSGGGGSRAASQSNYDDDYSGGGGSSSRSYDDYPDSTDDIPF